MLRQHRLDFRFNKKLIKITTEITKKNSKYPNLFKIAEKEVELLIDSFGNTNLTRERGIYFNEKHYSCLRSDEQSIYAKDVLNFLF